MSESIEKLKSTIYELIEQENIENSIASKVKAAFDAWLNKGETKIALDYMGPSYVRLIIMIVKGGTYKVIGRIVDNFISKLEERPSDLVGYRFQGEDGMTFDLRLAAVKILSDLGHLENARLNPNGNYLISTDGNDLRELPRIVVSHSKIYTKEEMDKFIVYFEELRQLMMD
jgi:hypothetical protein